MTPSRPYLIRAVHEWILDNGMTPYVLVNAQMTGVNVPRQYIENGKIILNLSPSAVRRLNLSNDGVSFDARFGGTSYHVAVPSLAVLAIYARENGKGMVFENNEGESTQTSSAPQDPPPPTSPPTAPKPGKPALRLVK